MYTKSSGFTLIEMLVTMAVAAILLTIAIPSFTHMIDQNRLKSAAEGLYADLQFARTEAIKRNKTIRVFFSVDGSKWCYGVTENDDCDCTGNDPSKPCEIDDIEKIVSSDEFTGISITDPESSFSFEPLSLHGGVNNDTIIFRSMNNKELGVVVSTIGRVRLCSPSGTGEVSGYPEC